MHCPTHEQSCYLLKNSHGEEELIAHVSGHFRVCDCRQWSCLSAGYFPLEGALYIPGEGHETTINSPNCLSVETKKELLGNKPPPLYLCPWHFYVYHHKKGVHGKWKLKYDRTAKRKFYDLERSVYGFSPPRNAPQRFIDEEYLSMYVLLQDRWAQENAVTQMPSWMLNMLAIDGSCIIDVTTKQERGAINSYSETLTCGGLGHITSMKRMPFTHAKCDEIRDTREAKMQKQKDQIVDLEKERASNEKQLDM